VFVIAVARLSVACAIKDSACSVLEMGTCSDNHNKHKINISHLTHNWEKQIHRCSFIPLSIPSQKIVACLFHLHLITNQTVSLLYPVQNISQILTCKRFCKLHNGRKLTFHSIKQQTEPKLQSVFQTLNLDTVLPCLCSP